MKLLLDTSVLIAYTHDDPETIGRLLAHKAREVSFSVIVLMEALGTVHYGDGRPANRDIIRKAALKFPVLPFDAKAAECGAALFAKHKIRRNDAPVFDGLIAAHAQSLDVPLAYIDGDFNRFAIKKQLWSRPVA